MIYKIIFYFEDVCDPLTIANGEVTIPDQIKAGHVAKILCHINYKLNQSVETFCLSSGTWSNIPTCRPLNCGIFVMGDHMHEVNKTNLNVCFECDEEYKMLPENQICATCRQNESWSKKSPNCTERVCQDFNVTNGDVIRDKYTANVTCKFGYNMSKNETFFCDIQTEVWSSIPECLPVDCGEFAKPSHGTLLHGKGHTFESIVSLVCNESFIASGYREATCLHTGAYTCFAT